MINTGHLAATIEQAAISSDANGSTSSSEILRFHSTSSTAPSGSDSSIDAQIQTQLQKIETLSAFIKEADRRLAVSKEYIEWNKRQKKSDLGAAHFEDAMDTSWGPPGGNADDEDIMGQ